MNRHNSHAQNLLGNNKTKQKVNEKIDCLWHLKRLNEIYR